MNRFSTFTRQKLMSIRQIRLNEISKIKAGITRYIGRRINIVLENKTSLYGELKEVNSEGIIVENRRLKKIKILFNELNEVYFDEIV
jgi:ribosome maturation factor RimP